MPTARVRAVLTYIAANVRRIRSERGLTQERLAEAADVHLTFLQEIERAQANPSIAVLVAVADALEVELSELLQQAEMPEIRRGRPRKAPVEAAPPAPEPAKPARKASKKAASGGSTTKPATPAATGKGTGGRGGRKG